MPHRRIASLSSDSLSHLFVLLKDEFVKSFFLLAFVLYFHFSILILVIECSSMECSPLMLMAVYLAMEINSRCLGSFLAQFEKLRTLSSSIPCVHLYDGNLGKTFSLLIRVKLAGGVKDAYTLIKL